MTPNIFIRTFATLCAIGTITLGAQEEPRVKPLAIGASAPDFLLPGTDGKTYSLNSFKDSDYIVAVFTCNHCPDARAARDRINQFAKDYAHKGVQVVAISGNDPKALQKWELGWSVYGDCFEDMKSVAQEHHYVFPYLYDGENQSATRAYGAQATPHVFILNPERQLVYHGQFDNGRRNPGPASQNTVRDTIDALLAGKPISKSTTRVFGCSTKWSWKRDLAEKKKAEWLALPVTVAPLSLKLAKDLSANATENVRVINLWSTSCGPCIAEFPDLIDAYQRYQRRNFDLITIAIDPKSDAEKVSKFLVKQHLPLASNTAESLKESGRKTNNFHYQGDDLEALATSLDAAWLGPIPHTIVIAPGGKILYRHSGQINPVELRRQITKAIESSH